MKCIVLMMAAAVLSPAFAAPTKLEQVEAAALKGDYQAQRNLAFGYVSAPYEGQQKNPLLGCAWYQVVMHSGSMQVDDGDIGNARLYCGRLDADQRAAATAQARQIFKRVYRRNASF